MAGYLKNNIRKGQFVSFEWIKSYFYRVTTEERVDVNGWCFSKETNECISKGVHLVDCNGAYIIPPPVGFFKEGDFVRHDDFPGQVYQLTEVSHSFVKSIVHHSGSTVGLGRPISLLSLTSLWKVKLVDGKWIDE